jgi:hypothetical protein
MVEFETLIYLTMFSLNAMATLYTLYGVIFSEWLWNKNYTRLTATILCFSLIHACSSVVQYLLPYSPQVYSIIECMMSISGLFTMMVYCTCELELLNLFRAVTTYWTQKRVRRFQLVLSIVQLIIGLPNLIGFQLWELPEDFWFEVTHFHVVVYGWNPHHCSFLISVEFHHRLVSFVLYLSAQK